MAPVHPNLHQRDPRGGRRPDPPAGNGCTHLFSVGTGALLRGAAGLLKGRRTTTHWASASFHLLHYFGAIPVNQRVVIDRSWVFAPLASQPGSTRPASGPELRGEEAAQTVQLHMVCAPETAVILEQA